MCRVQRRHPGRAPRRGCLCTRSHGRPASAPVYTGRRCLRARARRGAGGWHQALAGLSMKQEHAVERYLVAGEHVEEWLAVPLIDESMWWLRLGLGVHEHPPIALLAQTSLLLLTL